jgi:hypothetical protein
VSTAGSNLLSDDDGEPGGLLSDEEGFTSQEVTELDTFVNLGKHPFITTIEQLILNFKVDTRIPTLSRMAFDYLAIPASSVPAERQNSIAKHVFENRETLSDPVFKAEICCKAWIKLFKSAGIQLPAAYGANLNPNRLEELAKDDEVAKCLLDCN